MAWWLLVFWGLLAAGILVISTAFWLECVIRYKSKGKDQLKWLKSTLKESKADWLVVVGHFPVYSGGEHGNTKELLDDVLPLLEKYQVGYRRFERVLWVCAG